MGVAPAPDPRGRAGRPIPLLPLKMESRNEEVDVETEARPEERPGGRPMVDDVDPPPPFMLAMVRLWRGWGFSVVA